MNKVEFKLTESRLTTTENPVDTGYILLTGATGLVGQYLLKDLFLQRQKLAVLVRPSKKLNVRQRIENILQRWENELGQLLPRPVLLEGNLDNESLSLSDQDLSWAHNHCDRIIHNAAVLKFEGPALDQEPWQTNLNGTQNVIQFATDKGIDEFHYVSTAYVSGLCEEVFKESDLEKGQSFRNDYERSKFEAEKAVRQSNLSSKTIYRPAVIVGDSKTGYTASYHGLHVYLRLMATLIPNQKPDENGIRRTPIKMPVQSDKPRNLVPVDWISKVISSVVCDSSKHGDTYNLVPDTGLRHHQLLDYCYEYFNSEGVEFSDESEQTGPNEHYNDNDFAQQFLNNISVYSAYDSTDPTFDKQNVERLGSQFECPEITKDVIFRFLDFGEKDKWGKSKIQAPKYECWLTTDLSDIRTLLFNGNESKIGLNVLGPGGGQWTASLDDEGNVAFARGLNPKTEKVVSINPEKRPASNSPPVINDLLKPIVDDIPHGTG